MRAARHRAVLGLFVIGAILWAGRTDASQSPVRAPSTPAIRPVGEVLPVTEAALAGKGMEIAWKTEMLLEPRTALKHVWLRGKFLVGLADDQRVFTVNSATGVRLWSREVAAKTEKVWAPCVAGDTVYVATTTKALGYNMDGRVVVDVPFEFSPSGRPVTNGVHLFVPDAKGWLEAVSLLPKVVSWGRWTDNAVTSGPVMDSALIYFAGQDGIVYASTQNVRRVLWQHKTEGPIVADLALTKTGLVLVASSDYALYAFAGAGGRLAWRYESGEPLTRNPYAVGGQVFLFSKEAGLTAIEAANGHKQWTMADGQDFLSADPMTAYFLSKARSLVAVNRVDGKVEFTLPLLAGTLYAPNDTENGLIYLALPGGKTVAAAKQKEQEKTVQPGELQPPVARESSKPAPAPGK